MQIFLNIFLYGALGALVFLSGDTVRQVVAVSDPESVEIGIQELSPKGDQGGVAVPASGGSHPLPTCNFSISPNRLTSPGGGVTLTWSTTRANGVLVDQGVGVLPLNGSAVVNVSSSKTFTLRAGNDGGVTTCTASVTVVQVPTCDSFTITPSRLPYGGGVATFAWSTSNADSVTIDNGVGAAPADGSRAVSVLTTSPSRTYTLTTVGGGTPDSLGTPATPDTCTATVTTDLPPTAPPTCTLTITPATLPAGGGNTTFAWSSSGADTLSINGTPMLHTQNPGSPLYISTSGTFTATVTGPGGTGTCSDSVVVANTPIPPPTATIEARANGGPWLGYPLVLSGATPDLDLRWSSTNATSCVGTEFIVTPTGAVSGTQTTVTAPTANQTKTYTVTCTGPGGSATDTISVTLFVSTLPTATIEVRSEGGAWTGNNITINEGDDLDLRWSSTESYTCSGTEFTVTPSGAVSGTQTSVSAPPEGQSRTYTVRCNGIIGGVASDSLTVTTIPNSALPTATIEIRNNGGAWTGSNINIAPGDDLDLRWTSTNASTCTGGSTFTVTPSGAVSGTQTTVTPPATIGQLRTYTVTCTASPTSLAAGASASDSVSATVQSIPPSISADPMIVRIGEDTTLTWSTGSAAPATCSVTGPGLGTTYTPLSSAQGTANPVLEAESVYTITCPTGTDSVRVKVLPRIQET